MTYRDIISDIRSDFRILSSDAQINDRAILSQIRSVANMIVGQSLSKRKYWQSPTLFTPIQCLEMEEAPLSECCEYTSDIPIAKSVKLLPRMGEGVFGLAVQGVFGMNNSIKFRETNPNRYANLLRLQLPNKDRYFWVQNNHLYVTNSDTRLINLFAYFTEPVDNNLLFPGKDCDCKIKPSIDSLCANPLDQTFHFVEERLNDLKQQVYKNLLATYFNSKQQNTSDNKDEQAKQQ